MGKKTALLDWLSKMAVTEDGISRLEDSSRIHFI